jgi:hypothetical protein
MVRLPDQCSADRLLTFPFLIFFSVSLMVSICPLRVEELMEILAIQFDEEALPIFNTDWCPAYAEETIMSVCSSLIAIVDRGGHQVIQFSHFSVKYLTSE